MKFEKKVVQMYKREQIENAKQLSNAGGIKEDLQAELPKLKTDEHKHKKVSKRCQRQQKNHRPIDDMKNIERKEAQDKELTLSYSILIRFDTFRRGYINHESWLFLDWSIIILDRIIE